MKKIEVIIRSDKLEDLKDALTKAKVKGMTVSQVLGHGNQKGYTESFRGQKITPTLLAKLKIEIITQDDSVEKLVDIIIDAVYTGEVGDGKIFILPIDDVIRIRTKERGKDAL